MKHLQACRYLLVATFVSLTTAVNYNDQFYTVDKTTDENSITTFQVTGQGVKDTFIFSPKEDQSVYKTDGELIIGNKVYIHSGAGSFKRYFATVVEEDKCSERTFGFGRYLYTINVNCEPIVAKIKNAHRTLFSTRFNEDYADTKYTVNKKENGKGATVQVLGKGIEDQFVFNSKDEAVVYNSDETLVVGDKVFSDTANSIVLVERGKCTEKEYDKGKIIQVNSLTQARCKKVIEDMKKAKEVKSHLNFENDGVEVQPVLEQPTEVVSVVEPTPTEVVQSTTPATLTEDRPDVSPDIQLGFTLAESTAEESSKLVFANDKVKPNSQSITVDQISDERGTVVNVVGKGIKDKFTFAPEEDISVRKTDKVLVVGDKLYTDKENSISVVYGRMCIERIYKQSLQVIGREMSNEECDSVIYNIKMAKINIPSDNDKTDFDNPTFKVSVNVIGRGIKDKFNIPYVKETKIFNKDNILVIGDNIFTNKSNSLIEIEGGKCKEISYTHGYRTSENNLPEELCKEVKKEISAVKFSGEPLGSFADNGKTNDFEAPFFLVRKVPYSEFYTQVDVIGNGVKDKFYIPFNQDANVYDKDNVLIVGERLYTDKPNRITEIVKGGCTEFTYENGKRVGSETMIKHDCDEINLKMSLVNRLDLDGSNKGDEENDDTDGTNKVDKKEEARIIAEYIESLPDWLQDMISTVPNNKKNSFFSGFSF